MKIERELDTLVRQWLAAPEWDLWMEPGFEEYAPYLFELQNKLLADVVSDSAPMLEANKVLATFSIAGYATLD